jgi:hypothetical protein
LCCGCRDQHCAGAGAQFAVRLQVGAQAPAAACVVAVGAGEIIDHRREFELQPVPLHVEFVSQRLQ